jgi:glycosyltransferase involved in cell wall biosynthesis
LSVDLFLFSGLLRPYKGWDVLLEAFAEVKRMRPEAVLLLAGEPWGEAKLLAVAAGANVRRRGLDFAVGATLGAPRRLSPEDVALLASMNVPNPLVRQRASRRSPRARSSSAISR